MQDHGELQQAEAHCRRLLDFGDPARERAKQMLAEVLALQAEAADDDMALDLGDDTPPRPVR